MIRSPARTHAPRLASLTSLMMRRRAVSMIRSPALAHGAPRLPSLCILAETHSCRDPFRAHDRVWLVSTRTLANLDLSHRMTPGGLTAASGSRRKPTHPTAVAFRRRSEESGSALSRRAAARVLEVPVVAHPIRSDSPSAAACTTSAGDSTEGWRPARVGGLAVGFSTREGGRGRGRPRRESYGDGRRRGGRPRRLCPLWPPAYALRSSRHGPARLGGFAPPPRTVR